MRTGCYRLSGAAGHARPWARCLAGPVEVYEGPLDVEERLVADLIASCRRVADVIKKLPPLREAQK